ncbi:MAG: hypothetical protein JHC93_06785 [Parachlamydiales bacterium]|nr:hypothetical protein [Parachlamydiales bacterium]
MQPVNQNLPRIGFQIRHLNLTIEQKKILGYCIVAVGALVNYYENSENNITVCPDFLRNRQISVYNTTDHGVSSFDSIPNIDYRTYGLLMIVYLGIYGLNRFRRL